MSDKNGQITLPDALRFLQELQQELKTQDHDCQASPRFWVIGDYEVVPCPDGEQDEYRVVSPESGSDCTLEEYLRDIDQEELSDEAREALEDLSEYDGDGEWADWFKEYCPDRFAYLVPVKQTFVVKQNTMFLTKAEAKLHLKLNSHHYSGRAHTYAMTAWRAPRVARLLEILEAFDWTMIANLQKRPIRTAEVLASRNCPPREFQDNCPAWRVTCSLQTCTECWVGALERMGKGEEQ